MFYNQDMNWQSYLRTRTRNPAFLWRMVLGILAAGVILGKIAEVSFGGAAPGLPEPSVRGHWEGLEDLAHQGRWWQLWWEVPREIYYGWSQPGIVALSVLAGVCWLVFLLQSLRISGIADWRLWAAFLAIALGVLSIWPTGFLILWQEEVWRMQESAEALPGIRYFILGVGLREEFAKALGLLPLLAVIVSKRDELAALLLSGCVGLGFAIEENVGYIGGSMGTDTLGRFLVASPLHITLTGLIGLAVYRACRDPQTWGLEALVTFLLLVIAHGIYDALVILPAFQEYSFGATIVFALVVYRFFHELRSQRPSGGDIVSLTATFLCSVSLLAAATFIYVSALVGTGTATDVLFANGLSLALMVYLFLREMPESMIRV